MPVAPSISAVAPAAPATAYRLTDAQKAQYREQGYLIGLPQVFQPHELPGLRSGFDTLVKLLKPDEDPRDIREWHEHSRWLYDLCVDPRILDLVEGLLGPNFFFWASNFFAKPPRSTATVGWHQDAYYWDLKPHNTVTVWIAFTDVDEGNGAMQVIPASQRSGIIQHTNAADPNSVLHLQLEHGKFNVADAVSLNLNAGEISIHDDNLIHGSPANPSDRWRIGLTVRYSGTNVKYGGAWDSRFRSYMARGVDTFGHNRQGELPTQRFGRQPNKPEDRKETRDLTEFTGAR
ncbi:MAG TPA: phytanoyl-CoA dioxygenase family protein [Planctomycetota bacterium]|jgi:chlorinating enzyme|nr:phytanoyl-CoA dioxygenase family protein [Planctomycetota bacterium]